MKLPYYLDMNKLEEHLKNGYVEQRFHNTLPLVIYCYSRKATFDNVWDEVTTKCRGLIVEAKPSMEIIARPFEKFFNLNHAGRPETDMLNIMSSNMGTLVFSEKLDGSMGTYWRYKDQHGIATKGSFHSEQAEWATAWLSKRWLNTGENVALLPSQSVHAFPVGYTPVFEIIAQSVQHHVIHYHSHEDNRLVLIGLVNNETGAEMEPEQLMTWASVNGLDVVDSWKDLSLYEATQIDREGKEGYIATWYRNGTSPLKVKIKHTTFLKLQKIAHHTTPKTIFQALREDDKGAVIEEALKYGSPYLRDQVKAWMVKFDQEFQRISIEAREIVKASLTVCTTRKESATYFHGMTTTLAPVCFNILDQKSTTQTIWELVEPLVKTIKFDEVEAE